MDPRLQDARGRAKEALGAITGNKDLKASGAADQSAARTAKALQKVAKNAKGVVDNAASAATEAIDTATKKLKP